MHAVCMSTPRSIDSGRTQVPASVRRTNDERTRLTRDALMRAARRLFVDNGYAATGTPEIVRAANVTRGALYHHFLDKTDLLRAVVTNEAFEVAASIERDFVTDQTALDALIDGATAWFDAMTVPGRARLLLIEGPAVLGHAEMQRIDSQSGGASLRLGLAHALDPDGGKSLPIGELSEVLSAAFDRAALAIAEGNAPDRYRAAMRLVLVALLNAPAGSEVSTIGSIESA